MLGVDNLVDKVVSDLILYMSQKDLSLFQCVSKTQLSVTCCFILDCHLACDWAKDR